MASAQPKRKLFLRGDGVSSETLGGLVSNVLTANDSFDETEITSSPHHAENTFTVIADIDIDRLERAFSGGLGGCFEVLEMDQVPPPQAIQWLAKRGPVFSFSSKTIYHFPIANFIALGLSRQLDLTQDVHDKIELALHEALINAVVHGNFGLGHDKKNNLNKIISLDRKVDARLDDKVYAARRVEILLQWNDTSIEINITDQGPGLSLEQDKWNGMAWRGMNLITSLATSLTVGKTGHPLIMTFDR